MGGTRGNSFGLISALPGRTITTRVTYRALPAIQGTRGGIRSSISHQGQTGRAVRKGRRAEKGITPSGWKASDTYTA